jgi:hypothetical protein
MVIRKVELAPYVVELWIVITDNPKVDIPKLNKKYKGLNISWDDQTAAWTNDHFYDDNILAVAFDTASWEVNTVVHEAVHILNRTYEHAGAKLDTKNDEPQAYLTGWIVDEIYKAYEQFQKTKKNVTKK